MKEIILAFIPIFVAVDALGILPIFVSLTNEFNQKQKIKIIWQSILTALSLAVGFIFLGKLVFKFLGITIADFMVAGGIILFCIAIIDLLTSDKMRRIPIEEVGVVPLGTPLIVGPAVLTITLMMIDQYGLWPTLVAVILNISLVAMIFLMAGRIMRILGKNGLMALSKVLSLLLAAIAVMMIRKGVTQLINM